MSTLDNFELSEREIVALREENTGSWDSRLGAIRRRFRDALLRRLQERDDANRSA